MNGTRVGMYNLHQPMLRPIPVIEGVINNLNGSVVVVGVNALTLEEYAEICGSRSRNNFNNGDD